jgi:hypothetical protein
MNATMQAPISSHRSRRFHGSDDPSAAATEGAASSKASLLSGLWLEDSSVGCEAWLVEPSAGVGSSRAGTRLA